MDQTSKTTGKTPRPFPDAAASGRKDERLCLHMDLAEIARKDSDVNLRNLEVTGRGLRPGPRLASWSPDSRLNDVRAIYPFEDKLLFLNMESRHLGFYVYDGVGVTKQFVSVDEYPASFDPATFSTGLVYTMDRSPHLTEEENDKPKLLYFPANRYAVVTGGAPGNYKAMPLEMPVLEHAVISGGRLYGTRGQKVYVSGAGGCFDWQYDASGGEVRPEHAFSAGTTTMTEKQLPVTALRPYKDYVLIFRSNALQKITGSANPYAVKDLFRVGTSCPGSICEVRGELYFIFENEAYRFNGGTIQKLPCAAEGVKALGPACVFEGKYCFAAEKNGQKLLVIYDADSGSFGTADCPGTVRSFAAGAGVLAALIDTGAGACRLYALRTERSGTFFSARLPAPIRTLGRYDTESAALRVRGLSGQGSVSWSLCARFDDGSEKTLSMGAVEVDENVLTMRKRTLLRGASSLFLVLQGMGDVLLESCELRLRKKRGKNDKR